MSAVDATLALSLLGFVAGLARIFRHCLRGSWLDRVTVGILTGACALIFCAHIGRVSVHIDALPGNVRAWLWNILLLGVAVWALGKALERKR